MGRGVGGAAKLRVLKELVSGGFEARSVGVRRKKMRRILTKLKGGTEKLQVEAGRWRGLRGRRGSVQNVTVER